MAEQSNPPCQTSPEEENGNAEVYSVSQDQDGSLHFSRRDFLYFSLVTGGALVLKGVCPRFGAGSTPTTTQPLQAGMMPLPKVYVHSKPSIDSNIIGSLQQDNVVLLISDHPDVGWVEVTTRSGERGWLERCFVDFARAFTRSSQDFDLSVNQTVTPARTPKPTATPIQSGSNVIRQNKDSATGQAQSCGQAIQNGDFEGGHVSWVEDGAYEIITNSWADPYQGSEVAWLCGYNNAQDKLTQLFHMPADVEDAQTLEFYLKVTTEETESSAYDALVIRFLDAGGTPISADIWIADNTTPIDWSLRSIQLTGLASFASQDIQIQFEGRTDVSYFTNFIIDAVSLNLACGTITPTITPTATQTEVPAAAYYIYLPIIVRGATPIPSPTRTLTPTKTPTSGPCSCNTAPCSCNANPCSCNAYPTGPTSTPCICNANPCSCNSNPCSCNLAPYCPCNSYNCTCNTLPCSCNTAPYCPCNSYNCTCNTLPCSCNTAPYCPCNSYNCTCNTLPCSCNTAPYCPCNSFLP